MRFGQFTLKRHKRRLEGPGGSVDLSARAFDVLCLLLDSAGEVVTKDEIFATVWPGVVVGENTLQVHVSALRKALEPGMVVTVHGCGYKYAGPSPIADGTSAAADPIGARKPVIAVLRFANLSGDPDQQFLSDGIAEDIADRLTRFRGLAVIGQYSAFSARAEPPDLTMIRDQLQTDFLVTGSVRRAGERLRVSARLTDSATGLAVWADRYDRPLADFFDLQDELTNLIAAATARQLEIEISSGRVVGQTGSFACYEWLLRGNWHFNSITRAGTAEAAECYRRALAIEPRNAEALAALAVCHSSTWMFDFDDAVLHEGIRLARQACDVDPDSAMSLAVLGLALCWTEGLDAARGPLDRAVAINPSNWFCLSNRSLLSTYEGDTAGARSFLARAKALNPIPPPWHYEFECISYLPEGRFREALPGLEAIPEGYWDSMYAMACYGHLGLADKARSCIARFAAEGRMPDLVAGAEREPFVDAAIRKLLIDGVNIALRL